MRAAALALIGAVATAGCTWNTSQPLYAGANPAPLNLQISTIPGPDANGQVTRSAIVILTCDDYPDPDSALFGTIQVRSGAATFDIDIRVDLVDRAIVVTPRSLLAPNGQYQVVVQPGITALSGRTLTTTVSKTFAVSVTEGTRPAPRPAYTWSGDIASDIGTCAPACHSPTGASGRTRTPTRLLDLTGDPTDLTLGLINVPAQGELGWPKPLLRVAPGDSAHSALLRKLLGGNPIADSRDASIPAMAVDGRRMPIQLDDTQPTPPPLDDATIRRVQDWIDEGAPVQ
jgi:hypothetical protein